MRDYDNLPRLPWEGAASLARARAQILREEPLVLQMPADFSFSVPEADCQCKDRAGMIAVDCEPRACLGALARLNGSAELEELAAATHEAGLVVDVDPPGRRIIIHD